MLPLEAQEAPEKAGASSQCAGYTSLLECQTCLIVM